MIGKFASKRKIAKNTLEVSFDMPNSFVFEAGQYIQLVLTDNLKHYFSVTNSPNERNTLRIATRLSGSEFKNTLQSLTPATEVRVNGPWGDFVLSRKVRSYFFVAGGIGITPFISMLRYIREEKLTYEIELLYFGKNSESRIYADELKKLEKNNPNFKLILNTTNTLSLIKKRKEGVLYYIAGPPGFVNQIVNTLHAQRIDQKNIMTDSFTGY